MVAQGCTEGDGQLVDVGLGGAVEGIHQDGGIGQSARESEDGGMLLLEQMLDQGTV